MTFRAVTTGFVTILLLALIVSAGEGIRLFPIASPHGGIEAVEKANFAASSTHRYSTAASRSNSSFSFGKTKTLKKKVSSGSLHLGSTAGGRPESTFRMHMSGGSSQPGTTVSTPHLQLLSGRAPPVS